MGAHLVTCVFGVEEMGRRGGGSLLIQDNMLSLSFVMVWAVLVGWKEGGGLVAACLVIVG